MTLSLVGNSCLGLAFVSGIVLSAAPSFISDLLKRTKLTSALTICMFTCTGATFLTLTTAYVVSDFSLVTVALHSHQSKPLLYKIAGVWSNHEGSMLLWVLISTFLPVIFAYFSTDLKRETYSKSLQYMGLLNTAYLLYIALTSNPFFAVGQGPLEGKGMNPLLQDPAMAIHPPLLYIGYVGFMVPFCLVLAEIRSGNLSVDLLRKWVLATWGFLTIGITLGSYWAYYELGWGGWWFWDPVENASLMPWVLGVALIHSLLVTKDTRSLKRWSILLIYGCYVLCLLGTFLTRSGVLSSVHSFATSSERGIYIISFICLLTAYFGSAFFLHSQKLRPFPRLTPLTREGVMLWGNILFVLILLTILLGTYSPIFTEYWGKEKISLEAPFYVMTVVPLSLPVIGLMAIAPLIPTKGGAFSDWKYSLIRRLQFPLFCCMVGVFLTLFIYEQKAFYAVVFISASLFLLGGVIRSCRGRVFSIPFHKHGMHFAHLGFAISLLGMAVDSYNTQDTTQVMRVGTSLTLGKYKFTLEKVEQRGGPNFRREEATISVWKDQKQVAILKPEKRLYLAEKTLMSEVSLGRKGFSQFYAVLGEYQNENKWIVRLYYHPLVLLIWLGGGLIAVGALIALCFRRGRNRKK